ncbi:hypothetical protein EDB86DRAFT_2892517 [Lactarius hatsudake]|nr:hypothetical protein EDB86DRAFT_2892517 [Lactarius hatsudake]
MPPINPWPFSSSIQFALVVSRCYFSSNSCAIPICLLSYSLPPILVALMAVSLVGQCSSLQWRYHLPLHIHCLSAHWTQLQWLPSYIPIRHRDLACSRPSPDLLFFSGVHVSPTIVPFDPISYQRNSINYPEGFSTGPRTDNVSSPRGGGGIRTCYGSGSDCVSHSFRIAQGMQVRSGFPR